MATGTVKWFSGENGYGFIQQDGGDKDVFVNISAVEQAGIRSLNAGQKLQFEVVQNRRSGKSSAGNLHIA
jgi:CspA family cold shock protein